MVYPENGFLVVQAGYEQGHCFKLSSERPLHLDHNASGFVTKGSQENPLLSSDATCHSL